MKLDSPVRVIRNVLELVAHGPELGSAIAREGDWSYWICDAQQLTRIKSESQLTIIISLVARAFTRVCRALALLHFIAISHIRIGKLCIST